MRSTLFSALILLFALALAFTLSSQDYVTYQRTFNRIDEDVLDSNYTLALQRLDSIYHTYDFIYAKHCIKALQICCKANDSNRAALFLAKCFRQGVPLWIVRDNLLMRKSMAYSTTRYAISRYDSLRQVYRSSINLVLAGQIDSLFKIDQKRTGRINNAFIPLRYTIYYARWRHNNNKQFRALNEIIDKYGFPGERLIGIPPYYEDSSVSAKNIRIYGPDVSDFRAYFMLIHYYSNPGRDINDKLYTNVLSGYLPVSHYASINDYQAMWGRHKYGSYSFYNVWQNDPDTANLPGINLRRAALGLNSFAQQERNDNLELRRRRQRWMSSCIILE